MSFALVLGGGGITGAAWEAGILKGLRDAGVDLTEADLIIGTSAGAVVGAGITTGGLDAFWKRQTGPIDSTVERAGAIDQPKFLAALVDAGLLPQTHGEAPGPALGRLGALQAAHAIPQSALARLGQAAITAQVDFTEGERLRTMASRIGSNEWPDRTLMITAVDCQDGSLVVWTKDSGVPLIAAVASSCAAPFAYPPATVKGRRYMDGGMRSATNVDLAHGSDRIVVVTPVSRTAPLAGPLIADVERLEADGSEVCVIDADGPTAELIRQGPIDPANRPRAAEAGLRQSAKVVGSLPAWLTLLNDTL